MVDIILSVDSFFNDDEKKKVSRNKGKSLIQFPENYVVLDIETTGLNPNFDDIIEVSALKVCHGEIVDFFTSLIRPVRLVSVYDDSHDPSCIILRGKAYKRMFDPIDSFITDLTGITNKMLVSAPYIQDVLPSLQRFIGNEIIIGYNVNFDINFLFDQFKLMDIHFKNDFVDVMRIARKLLPELPNHKLQTVSEYFNFSTDSMHRGVEDCKLTFRCLSEMKKIILDKFGSYDAFSDLFKKYTLHSSDIISTTTDYDETHILYGKNCVFTGTLELMTRKEAMQHVVNIGGFCQDNVTKKTNFLILGNNDYCSSIKDGKSNKHKKAEALKLNGQDIEIIAESTFYDLLQQN